MTKVLIIEDSALMRIMLADKLRQDGSIKIVGTAQNGDEGIEKAMNLRPDIVITDMVMPKQDGLQVVTEIMRRRPIPIILLSSLDKSDNLVFDALKAGAVDFVSKSNLEAGGDGFIKLRHLVKSAGEINLRTSTARLINTNQHTFDSELNYNIIVMGASTGGPGALEVIIKNLPENLAVPLVIVQHMPHPFVISYTNRVSQYTPIKVSIPGNGDPVLSNTIYIAPGNTNLKIINDLASKTPIFRYTNKVYDEFNMPSVDCLFESAATVYGKKTIGVILTGMGRDGTKGLKSIAEKGGYTIAQDESTSVVYGMPKSAVDAGVTDIQLKLREISGYVVSCL